MRHFARTTAFVLAVLMAGVSVIGAPRDAPVRTAELVMQIGACVYLALFVWMWKRAETEP